MPGRDRAIRAVTLVDIPLVRRLSDKGIILDSELGLTGEAPGPHTTLLSSILLRSSELYTFVARADRQQVVGQFRLKGDAPNAHIVFIAPHLEDDAEDTAWLYILDTMAREAGKHGAHGLVAEVDERSPLFETMRTANFAVYARQEIWRRQPTDFRLEAAPVGLTEAEEDDVSGVFALLAMTVPSLIQQIAAPPGQLHGLVYRKCDRVEGYIAVSEGKQGIYLIPYLHPDIMEEASAVLQAAIVHTQRAAHVPVYVCVRRYQDWLDRALIRLQLEPWAQQAVMVKHIAAGVRHAGFEPLRAVEPARSPVPPPTRHTREPVFEATNQE